MTVWCIIKYVFVVLAIVALIVPASIAGLDHFGLFIVCAVAAIFCQGQPGGASA